MKGRFCALGDACCCDSHHSLDLRDVTSAERTATAYSDVLGQSDVPDSAAASLETGAIHGVVVGKDSTKNVAGLE